MPSLPGVNHLRAIVAFEKAGFSVARQGKHVVMTNGERIIVIPRANPINAYTMAGIVKDAGLTIEEFQQLL
ncbi:type II toxin-antitoxin system HicA family toxin [Tolypothrix campylonemoides VB511288]|nr:type II toxin-antitoxin system HicA family toxin [Tolypothrix campylonemoides VB511288]